MNDTTWIEEFASEIAESDVPDLWILNVDRNLLKKNDAEYFTQKTFGSFRCLQCKRAWSSSTVVILFRLTLKKHQRCGSATMRTFKQECQSCNNATMQEPTISNENKERVIGNVVSHIEKVFYGKQDVTDDRPPYIYGKLEGPHDEKHCEACKFHLCDRQSTSAQDVAIGVGGLVSALAIGVGTLALMYISKN
ncbi:receptor-transporting protein 4-like [Dendropsophus ebraccatus]|uniref:receptor-transporting protein 4-like n=1 Tax=Dendropsophus ebraccatus TaxID=150705 RepID=UPI003831F130